MKFCFEQPTNANQAVCAQSQRLVAAGGSVGTAPNSFWSRMRREVIGKGVMERRGDDGGGGGEGRLCSPAATRAAAATAATTTTLQHVSVGGAGRKSGRLAESTNDGAAAASGHNNNCGSHSGNVCLLCRQHMEECCLNCAQHYATAAATTTTTTAAAASGADNNNNNNSKHNSRRRNSFTANKRRRSGSGDSDSCHRYWQRHAPATTTTTTKMATHCATSTQCSCSSCCCWQDYNAAATTTTTTTLLATFMPAAATTTIATKSSQSCLAGESDSPRTVIPAPATKAPAAASTTTTTATPTECDCANWRQRVRDAHSQSQSSNYTNNNNNTIHNHHKRNNSNKANTIHHHHNLSHSAGTNTNSNHCSKHIDHTHYFTTTTITPPPTTTTTITNKGPNHWCSAFASSLRTLQFLMIYMQMQLVRPICNKFNKFRECLQTNITLTTTARTIATRKCKFNKRQQRPPHKRLMKIRCNSYYDNATNNFMNNDNDKASHKQQSLLQQQQLKQQFQACALRLSKAAAVHVARHWQHHAPQQQQQQLQQQCQLDHHYSNSSHHRQQMPTTLQQQQQQQQPQHLLLQQYSRYFKMPNLSSRYKILIVLSFLSLFLPSINAQASQPTHTQTQLATAANTPTVSLARNETVCKSLDIRNFPNETRQLQNCTVIEGFLLITLVNTHSIHEFNESYPLLTEVTEFIIIYRVHNLRSLAAIFPNLSIIRGRILFEGYALIVYSNPHLEELGLTQLTTISRGGVRVENNVKLCYVHTIDWSQIVTNVTDVMIVKNSNPIECQKCPGDSKSDGTSNTDLVCKATDGVHRCWNSKSCQKICPEQCRNNCIDEKTCCNEACIGGCSPINLNACTSCRHFSIFNNTCIDKCPSNYYGYLDRRCLTANECLSIRTKFENNKSERIVPYNGTCLTRCPPGYNKINSTCQKCGNKCVKKCVGGLIDSVERAKDFQGCTQIINSGLTISIKRGGRHLMEDLLDGLSSIQEITTYLKVQGTYGMLSLSYFKNLKIIRGETLYEDKFALYVLENNDLESIWAPNQTVEIKEGRVFFHFNPKLCFDEIEKLRSMMYRNHSFDKNEVARDSNGHKGSCNTELLNVTIAKVSARGAVATILNPLKFEDSRTFIGYQYFHMEDKNKNATKYSQRICDDGWTVSDPTKEPKYIFFNLQPFTQYAYYVKTWTISSERRNAQSPIQHFTTKSAQPQFVHTLNAYATSSSEIVITWTPPLVPHGNLTVYRVRAVLDKRSQVVESRNYCKDPAQIDKDEDAKDPTRDSQLAVTDQPQSAADCKCAKESSHNEIDTKESFIADRIDFENTLQNFVYVKHTKEKNSSRTTDEESGASLTEMDRERRRRRRRHSEGDPQDSFLVRHMRAMPDDLENKLLSNTNELSGDNSITTTAPLEDSTNSSINETRMDPSGKYHESIVGNVSVTTNKFVFTKLKHFSFYTVGVEACRAPEEGATNKECSDVRLQFVRTKKLDNVDKIQNLRAELEATNTTRGNVRLHWDPPEEPNGAVVSYTISFIRDSLDAVEEKKCITDLDYRNMTNGYILSGLAAGNYSIKVRANSLAGDGVYSEPVPVDIPTTQLSTALIVVLCVVVVGLIIAAIVTYALCKKMATPSDLKIFPTVNPYYISLQYIPDEWEVARDRVIQLSPLGQGSFGMVYEGILKGYNNSTEDTPCAIKTVNENTTDRERMNFLNEASIMKQFDTYHVVRLLGVCSVGQPALVVMELMKNGDLKSYLRAHRPAERDSDGTMAFMRSDEPPLQPPPLSRIYQMAIEIADGMAYLAAKKFVHRDLAARNCMVAADLTVKIGDFGMTRDIYETDYYRKGTKGLLPVRWMPPESLRDGVYSTASDVFSYGVVLWEMVTLASQPYPGYSNDQVLRFVIEGGVMERPENCPDRIYEMMQQCWEHRPSKRPSFLKIIRSMMDLSDSHFRDVSFFHSEEGQQELEKERADNMQNSGDVFNDDNEMDDVTTPLRMGEYNDYKLTIGNNSSVEHQGDSPMAIDDDQPHSPYSLASAIGVSSTPDGQSKNSFNLSQLSHNNPTLLSSVPSTSAGIISGGSHSHQLPPQRFAHHGRFPTRQPADELAAYVQPDYEPGEEQAGGAGHSVETDERGYELYDPSPNYREHAPYDPADDEEDFDGIGFSGGRGGKLSGGQNLLPRQKPHQRMPVVMSMSSSMPDEMINAPISSSLHPSTASAASSNASSTATATGRYPSLRKAVADTVQNVGNSLMPNRFRNRRFFNHKRSGSNASHKSTSSNPNTASSNSNSNLTAGPGTGTGDKSTSGHNLGTIESGGSGSAGSYAPRFFSPSSTTSTTLTSENPNYKLLDETANASCISAAGNSAATSTPTKTASTTMRSQRPSATAGFTTSTNPNYQLLDETLNATLTPTKPVTSTPASTPAAAPYVSMTHVSDNPNYEPMQAPPLSTTSNPNYMVMSAPMPPHAASTSPIAFAHMSENPNYQMMGPQSSGHGTSASSTTDDDDDADGHNDDHQLMEHIRMERIPLSRRRRSRTSRSRSQSQNKADDKASTPPTAAPATGASTLPSATQARPAASATFSLKEKWLRQQQAQPTPPPPPNGFIGREA